MTMDPGLDADLVNLLRTQAKAQGREESWIDELFVEDDFHEKELRELLANAAERIEFLFEAFAKCTRSLRSYHERIELLEAALEEIVKNPQYGGAHVIAWKALAGKS